MSFEERFASVGRWLDDLVWSLRTRSSSRDRVRGVTQAIASKVRHAQENAGEQLERVKYMHLPSTDEKGGKALRVGGIVLACAACLAAGLFVGPRVLGSANELSEAELAAMRTLREKERRTTLFTPASTQPGTDATAPATSESPAAGTGLIQRRERPR
jgi:hypothetical protein